MVEGFNRYDGQAITFLLPHIAFRLNLDWMHSRFLLYHDARASVQVENETMGPPFFTTFNPENNV
jgi:hypothetical protein